MEPDGRYRDKDAGLLEEFLPKTIEHISYKDHVSNVEARRKTQAATGEYDKLLTLVKKRKLRWFGHASESSGLANKSRKSQWKEKEGM